MRPAFDDLVSGEQPIAFWPLSETSGSEVGDRAGGHDGHLVGDVRLGQVAQGPTVTSAGFDGSSGFISVPGNGLAGASAASAWFRLSSAAGGTTGSVLHTGGLDILVQAGRLLVRLCPQVGACRSVAAAAEVDDGAWHQVVVSLAAQLMFVYVDGWLDGSPRVAGTAVLPTGQTRIGHGLAGDIDDVALFRASLDATAVSAQFRAGACPQDAGSRPADTSARRALPPLPLHTLGRFVVDALGHRVRFAGVNWYGAEELDRVPDGLQCQPVDAIAARIVSEGFTTVRLPWATDTWLGPEPAVPPIAVAANPALRGLGARAVFDRVVAALGQHGLLVILDNHVTRASWCCSGTDGNALWWEGYDPAQPPRWSVVAARDMSASFMVGQSQWLAAWRAVAGRYGPYGSDPQPAVVAADLRNEPRSDTLLRISIAWGGRNAPPWADWPRAATLGGDAVLQADPWLLVAVEGVNYATDLRGVAVSPIRLTVPHRLIYSAHDYAFDHGGETAAKVRVDLGAWWGWLLTTNRVYTTPVWVGEFGTCHPGEDGCTTADAAWFAEFTSYLRAGDIDWTYWSLDGTGARGTSEPSTCAQTLRFSGCDQGYGLLDHTWAANASSVLSGALRQIEPVTQPPA